MIRCCLCRHPGARFGTILEPTALPGTGYRCADRDACQARVREIIRANVQLKEACDG